jgi:hypothetical protein
MHKFADYSSQEVAAALGLKEIEGRRCNGFLCRLGDTVHDLHGWGYGVIKSDLEPFHVWVHLFACRILLSGSFGYSALDLSPIILGCLRGCQKWTPCAEVKE